MNKRRKVPHSEPDLPEVGVVLQCPDKACNKLQTCRIENLTSVLLTETVVYLQGTVTQPKDCASRVCSVDKFARNYTFGSMAHLLEIIAPESITVDLR